MSPPHMLDRSRRTARAFAPAAATLISIGTAPFRSACQTLSLVLLMACAPTAMAAAPDLTAGELRTNNEDTNLGPTGMRGWIYDINGDCLESRQILVTAVEEGSPAHTAGDIDGGIAANDVILGASGTGASPANFTADARKSLALAIEHAEARNPATLQLIRWRAGVTDTVQITLQTLGAYSATAPYNCPKSAAILEQGLQYVMANENAGLFSLGTLTLLAADDPSNPNNAARQARAYAEVQAMLPTAATMAAMNSDVVETGGKVPWTRGHELIVLAEYYLKTSDPAVLPAIEAHVNTIAKGQSPFGSMGHQFATLWPDSSQNGPVGGYGAVNSAAVPCFYGLLLAKECGITNPKLDIAIGRASRFFASYAGKGGIPYGEHLPGNSHNGNGKSGLAALAFELQGHRTYARDYFAQMAVASAVSREGGHSGYGFNVLWTPLGAAVGGEDAASSYFSRSKWNFDMSRRWDGGFDYGAPNRGTSGRRTNWRGLNMSTAVLLTYTLPLRKLQITGKNRAPAGCLTPALIDRAVLAEQYDPAPRSTNELLADLQSFSGLMRSAAAAELANRPAEKEQLLASLAAQANDLNGTLRTGACEALGIIADPRSAPVLVALLTDDDNNVRYFAARALRQFPRSVHEPLVYQILAAAAANAQPTFAMPEDDPAQFANAQLVSLLFADSNNPGSIGILKDSIVGIDRAYLYPAIRMATSHPLGGVRSTINKVYSLLTDQDVNALADVVVDSVHYQSPGDTMFSAMIRNAGLLQLEKRNIAEGVPLAEVMSDTDGRAGVSGQAIDVLAKYAGSATLVQPDPRTIDFLKSFWGSNDGFDGNLWPGALAALNAIAADTNPVAPTPFKAIQSVTADAPTLTLPANWTALRVKSFDHAKGDSRYTWRKVHGAGLVSFAPNGTASSKNTHVLFDGTPGQYLFEVTMSDSRGFTEVSQTVAVTLRNSGGSLPPNDPPTADAQALTIGEAKPTPITLTGKDPEGYALNYKITTPPTHGALTGTAPYLIYSSDFNYTGADSFTFEAMNSEGQVATATVNITVGAAAPTGLAVYEPFDYPAGALSGMSGTSEVGFAAPWTAPSTTTLASDSLAYGPLLAKGGKVTASSNPGIYGGSRVISPSALADKGLLNDGATLWMSAVVGNNPGSDAGYLCLALANSSFATSANQAWIQNEGAQAGAGVGFTLGAVTKGVIGAARIGNASGSIVVNATGNGTVNRYYTGQYGLVVAKITWGATPADPDLIEIYQPNTDLQLPAKPVTSITAQVDQSTFDTLTWYRSNAPVLDEIRIGADYRSVLLGSVAMAADSSPPVPNPIAFHATPAPSGPSSVRMVATSAYDPNGVEYYFTCTAGGGHDSGWQSSPEYTDIGLTPGVTYGYTVKARDRSPFRNQTAPSTASSATIPTSTQVPVVLNLSQADAEATITSMGFTVGSVTTVSSPTVDQGDVSAQTPGGGTTAALGTAVDLVISDTLQFATISDLIGQTQGSATTALAAQDLLVGTVFTDYSETVPAGQIKGTNPPAGTQVAFGTAVDLLVSAGSKNSLLPLTELLFEDFESPSSPVAYVQGSLPDNGKWVGASAGGGSTSRGITDKAGGDFSAPDPNHQAFALRATQSGITTAQGTIGTLTLNTRYSLSFDVIRDGSVSGRSYNCELVAFDPGTTRADARPGRPGSVLASASGTAPSDGSFATISLEFTAITANPHLGKDIGIRFIAPYSNANALIDNVSLRAVGVPLADTVPPTLLATSPADGATGVSVNEVMTLTFSENVTAGTGAVLLRNVTDGIQQFILTNDPSAATFSGSTLRLHPPGGLLANKNYTVLVDLGAVTDLAGNRFAGISDTTAWNFTTSDTDVSAPTVTIANDQSFGTVGVGDVVTYTLTFSERVNGTTLDAGDFSNAGTAPVSIGAITETSPGVFSVVITPTGVGTLKLQVNAGAVISDLAGNPLNTVAAIADEETITVIPPNTAPVWATNPVNEIAATENMAYSSTLANDASDAENDPLAFTKISGPAWLAVAPNGALSGTPANGNLGPNSFTVRVSDGINPPVSAILNISVIPANALIAFEAESGSIPYSTVALSGWRLETNANALGGQSIYPEGESFNAPTLPGGESRIASYTVTLAAAGTYDVYARLMRPSSATGTDSFYWDKTFGAPDSWQELNNLSSRLPLDQYVWVNISEIPTTPVTLTVAANQVGVPLQFNIASRERRLRFDAFALGSSNLTFTETQLNAAVAISNNTAPVFAANPIAGANATQGTAYTGTLAGSATDANNDTLTYAKVSGPDWLSVAPDGTLSGTPTNSDVGSNSFTVSVSDGIASPVTATLDIMVINVNDAPVWASNPVTGPDATQDVAYAGTLVDSAFDVDPDATLTFAKVDGSAWLTVAPDGTLSGTPSNSDVGLNEFTVSVSDGIAPAVEAILAITVINVNDAPVWASNPIIGADATAGTGYSASLAEFASDVDADTILSFSLVDGPVWLSVAADGTLSGTPGTSDAALNVFIVSVSDGIAEPVNTTLNITVIHISDEQVWKTSFGEADLSDLSADYDGDGLSNGEERIWGLDPTRGDSRNPIVTPLDPATGKFRYSRRDPARTGKTFTVWTSGNLANWTQDTGATQLRGPMVNAIETVEVTLTAPPVNGRLFVRVHASD